MNTARDNTPELEMQAIVEAAGECWHKYVTVDYFNMFDCLGETIMTVHHKCSCGEITSDCEYLNLEGENRTGCVPEFRQSDHKDLNELFRLADKLGFANIDYYGRSKSIMINKGEIMESFTGVGDTPADALRKALYEYLKERES